MPAPLLSLRGVSVAFGRKRVVDGLDLDVRAGERVALVGESGSGKTQSALAILRLATQARIGGRILFDGEDLLGYDDARMRRLRGSDIAMIFQEPMSALNPLYTIGDQIRETLALHEGIDGTEARARTIALLARTGIREPERRIDSYPHQRSGGQLQRAVIAMALACRPRLLIADEPTTALDTTIRARIVQLLLDLQREEAAREDREGGMAILLITHDLNLVRRFAQRVAVMEHGRLVETGDTAALFAQPRHPYTRHLLDSRPQRRIEAVAHDAPILLDARHLHVDYPATTGRWWRRDRHLALADASIVLREGETVGIVGESGSGKSTLAQAILDLIPVREGVIVIEGLPVRQRSRRARRDLRARLQVVFQDPYGSLSPRRTVAQIVGEGLALHRPDLDAAARDALVREALAEVGLPESALQAYPHAFSGGQRQRIAIARAVVLKPRIIVLDEPTSALDVSVQNQVLELLVGLQKRHGLSYVLISHDLAVVNALAHRIHVMRDGRIVESGETRAVIADPRHEYTRQLVQAAL